MENDKIVNIHGIEVDRLSHPIDVQRRETQPTRKQAEILKILNHENLQDLFPNGFLIYIHKTKSETACESILKTGLHFYEEGGGLESTMSKVYDSKSTYQDGDENYLFNCINEPNQYGAQTVLAIFGRKQLPSFSPSPDCLQSLYRNKGVPPACIIGYITADGRFVPGEFTSDLISKQLPTLAS